MAGRDRLAVLSVAYPFAAVGPDAVGGAEQVLSAIDEALVDAGHRSIVIACEGSRVRGLHVSIREPEPGRPIDDAARAAIHARVRQSIAWVLRRERVDVVHLHGVDFGAYLPAEGPPVLATLHLPCDWYPLEFAPSRTGPLLPELRV